ncbi:hypothetical protein I3F58_28450 [Streptomyces sp. MUM 203J]|uniref:hypothetical protein n=1 Tax=Streptomyces sp. MUM 203J TaxID=2791990 RepID=UPI001F03318E|nr:hypothetical protein [Streptomyces sp. MUM 203J]MCH0543410.1 hypothetical protein [Streptomyces sp. MUM 203J]
MASGAGKWERVPLVPQTGTPSGHDPGPGTGRRRAHARPSAPAPESTAPPAGTANAADAAPLFASLAREWRAQGRVVPGARDHEWDTLVRRPVWPRR